MARDTNAMLADMLRLGFHITSHRPVTALDGLRLARLVLELDCRLCVYGEGEMPERWVSADCGALGDALAVQDAEKGA